MKPEQISPPASIAIISPGLSAGGGERVFLNLANEFIRQGINVQLVVFNTGGELLPFLDEKVQLVNLQTRLKSSLGPLMRYLRSSKPQIVITGPQFLNFMVIIARMLSRSPAQLIVTHHNFHDEELQRLGFLAKISSYLLRLLYPRASFVVAVSNGLKQYLAETVRIRSLNIVRIYNPVVSSALYNMAQEIPGHEWLIHPVTPIIIAVGRLVSVKNFPMLITAFHSISTKTNARMIIVGDGPEKDSLDQLIRSLGLSDRVSLAGATANPYAYIARAQLMAVSSNSETFSIAIVEALSLGIPVVSTATIGASEVLAGGTFGTLTPVGDTAEFANRMLQALQTVHDTAMLKQRAEDFTVAGISGEYLKLTQQKV